MNSQPIQDFVQKTKQIDPRKLGRKTFTYIDIAAIDREMKQIVAPQLLAVEDAPSRARKLLHSNDVLVSTVRPNLNAVAIVPSGYDGEIGSTGFCVLRTRQEILNAHYLYFFTRTSEFISRLTKIATGANYPAVSDDDILETEIPLPSPSEQRRIAAILARADRLRRLRRTALHLSDSYLQSVFVQMFGDPVTNPMGWDFVSIEELGEVQGGLQLSSKRKNLELRRPYLRVANIFRDTLDLSEIKQIELTKNELARVKLQKGDILIVEGHGNINEIGRCSVWNGSIADCVHQNHLIRVRPDSTSANSIYLSRFINSSYGRRYFTNASNTTSGLNTISTSIVKDLPVLNSPLPLQQRFAAIAARYERLRTQQREALRQAEHLFDTLLHRAFRGELGDGAGAHTDHAAVTEDALVQMGMGLE